VREKLALLAFALRAATAAHISANLSAARGGRVGLLARAGVRVRAFARKHTHTHSNCADVTEFALGRRLKCHLVLLRSGLFH